MISTQQTETINLKLIKWKLNIIKLKDKFIKVQATAEELEEEVNNLTIYKTETDAKVAQYETRLKNSERELDITTNLYKRCEDKLIKVKKEFEAQQR